MDITEKKIDQHPFKTICDQSMKHMKK